MRILSQDKKITTEYKNAVGIKEVETPIKTKSLKKTKKTYTISNQLDGMYGVPLGIYENEERATEILLEIHKCTLDRYEMPEK